LLLLAQFGKEGKPKTVIPKMSQETLADDRHNPLAGKLRYESLPQTRFIEYNGALSNHSSLLNVILND
jgi:CRP/FNR family transcriptional regulator, cyclic AMP receptor protein